jgi:DNA-binding MarR family transcriptional regulator
MNYDHDASLEFRSKYGAKVKSLSASKRTPPYGEAELGSEFQRAQAVIQDLEKKFPWAVQVDNEEERLGKTRVESTRKNVWCDMLREKYSVFIDMPDYSKTDRRMMAKDLEEIYWLWQSLNRFTGLFPDSTPTPNIVIAIQKEMFGGHFFFDKMQKVELHPLQPERMVEAYERRFKNTDPFTSDALLTLARMSRGIFRRFLRYIMLTLDFWEEEQRVGRGRIEAETVREAVTMEQLAEDMELGLADLFPKHSDLRGLAVRLLLLLQERGERKQSELGDALGVEAYALSRLLTKLEAAHYIIRRRAGNDKIVSLFAAQNRGTKP